MATPVEALDGAFRSAVTALTAPATADLEGVAGLDPRTTWQIFDAQASSRHLDFVARELQGEGRGFYTIGSAGHESNAAVALALRPTDPALLHYRSGGFYAARASQVDGSTPARDVLQSLMGAADEPIAGGRHKVFGNTDLSIIPQTSTIASHVPRAVGLAIALRRAKRLGVESPWPHDSVVVCSIGDASINHSTAVGAINTAINTAYRGLPVPLVLLVEDNGLGISVPTPAGWVETAYSSRPGLAYMQADGTDPARVYAAAAEAAHTARRHRRPVLLHLSTVRYLGHAGSDAEISYRTTSEIERDYAQDPLLGTARALVASGYATPAEVLERYDAARAHVDAETRSLGEVRLLESAAEVMAPISPRTPDQVERTAMSLIEPEERPARTLSESINATLGGALAADRRFIVFGEDVGRKGGVYGATRGLTRRFGHGRVFDTLLDEQSILGLGLGASLAGLVPVPEIQYLAYLHNAEDQLRGEAATLSFFSQGQYRNPMVVRIAGLAYQKGFGGHFHNDNSPAILRDIPGLVVACPSRGDDAAAMLRTCLASALEDGTVNAFLEPIALYHTRDLLEDGDGAWLAADSGTHAPIGRARTYGDGTDLTILTFGNGVPMSLRVGRHLTSRGIGVRVVDLRWLSPLPVDDIVREAEASGRVLVADETRANGGVGEGVITALVEAGFTGRMARVSSQDSFIPLGTAANHVLLNEDEIEKAALAFE